MENHSRKPTKKIFLVKVTTYLQNKDTTVKNYREDLLILTIVDADGDDRVIMKRSRALCLGDESEGRQKRPMDDLNVASIDFDSVMITLNTKLGGETAFVRTAEVIGPEEAEYIIMTAVRDNIAVEIFKFIRRHWCYDQDAKRPFWIPKLKESIRNKAAMRRSIKANVALRKIDDGKIKVKVVHDGVKEVELKDGATVADVLRAADVYRWSDDIRLNAELVTKDTLVYNRDIITLFPSLKG